MTLTAGAIQSYLDFNLGGTVPPAVGLLNIVNQAGTYLTNSHPWRWLMARPMHLDLRGKITISGASLSADGLTLTQTAAFASYPRVIGDEVELTDGTDGTGALIPGFYEVLAKTDNTLTLRTAASTGTVTAINGLLDTNTVALPDDFKSVVPVSSLSDSDAIINGLIWGTPQYINDLRTNAVGGATFGDYHGCIGRAGPTPAPANEPITWILEISQSPSANERNAFSGFYNAKWTRVVDANEILFLPEEGESCFVTLCEHFAKARMEADNGTLAQRLREFHGDADRRIPMDPDLEAFKRWDGGVQSTYGIMRGGAAQRGHLGRHASVPVRFSVADPS